MSHFLLKYCSKCRNELEDDTGFLCISCADILERECEEDLKNSKETKQSSVTDASEKR